MLSPVCSPVMYGFESRTSVSGKNHAASDICLMEVV